MHDSIKDLKAELLQLHKERQEHMEKIRIIDKTISSKLGMTEKNVRKKCMTSKQFLTACL